MINIAGLMPDLPFSKIQKSNHIQPALMLRKLQQVLASKKKIFSKSIYVPDHLTIVLPAAALQSLKPIQRVLAGELSAELAVYCQKKGWLSGQGGLHIEFKAHGDMQPGMFSVAASFSENFNKAADKQAQITLYARWGAESEDVFNILAGTYVLGRGSRADIVINDRDLLISQQHCRLTVENGAVWIDDLQSSNGSSINGRRIAERCLFGGGDLLQIGNTEVMFAAEAANKT